MDVAKLDPFLKHEIATLQEAEPGVPVALRKSPFREEHLIDRQTYNLETELNQWLSTYAFPYRVVCHYEGRMIYGTRRNLLYSSGSH